MPPFTNTASPLAAALGALLLSFLVLCEGKKKEIKMGQKHAGRQVVYLENKKRNSRKWFHSLFKQSPPNFTYVDFWIFVFVAVVVFFLNKMKWKKKNADALRFKR